MRIGITQTFGVFGRLKPQRMPSQRKVLCRSTLWVGDYVPSEPPLRLLDE